MKRLLLIKHMPKIKFILIMVLLLIGFLIYQIHSEKPKPLIDSEQTQKPQINPKTLIQIPKTTVINTDVRIEIKSISESEYNQLSIDIKDKININCREYFNLMKLGIDPLVTQVKLVEKLSGQPFQEAQLYALEIMNKKCEQYLTYQDRLKQDLSNDLFLNYSSGINIYLTELNQMVSNEEMELAIIDAKVNLFNPANMFRNGALGFLIQNPDWIESINLQIGISDSSLHNSQENISRAIELRACELNLEDCSETSFGMLLNCLFDYETCGFSLYEHTVQFATQSDLVRIELYLNYFRRSQD